MFGVFCKKKIIKTDSQEKFIRRSQIKTVNRQQSIVTDMIYVEGNSYINSFLVSKYMVTQKDFQKIMGYNPATMDIGDDIPVNQVKIFEAMLFCNMISEREGFFPAYKLRKITKRGERVIEANVEMVNTNGYRLPTLKEWQYAASGGNKSNNYKYSGSNNLDEVGWYSKNVESWSVKPVGLKKPNELGIYDMSGNIGEMTETEENSYFLVCGGNICSREYECEIKAVNHTLVSPNVKYPYLSTGFRLFRSL